MGQHDTEGGELAIPSGPWYISGHMEAFRRLAALASLLILTASGAAAQTLSLEGYEFRAGLLWIGNGFTETDNGEAVHGSEVSPLRFSPGFSLLFRLPGLWRFTPGIDLYYQEYLDPDSYDKVVPTQIETGSGEGDLAGTFGLLFSLPVGIEARTAEGWRLGLAASPTLTFRLPLIAIEGSDTAGLFEYFFASGRFFTPELRMRIGYEITPQLEAAALLRGLYPIANLYADTEPGVAWWDEMMVALTLSIAYRRGSGGE